MVMLVVTLSTKAAPAHAVVTVTIFRLCWSIAVVLPFVLLGELAKEVINHFVDTIQKAMTKFGIALVMRQTVEIT